MSTGKTLPAGPALAAVIASIITTCTVIATIGDWGGDTLVPSMRAASASAWIIFAIITATSQILAEMRALAHALTASLEDYGLEQHSSGVDEGIRRSRADQLPQLAVSRPR